MTIPAKGFFFSSRRRHTRYIGDWSSDVCSSDLIITEQEIEELVTRFTRAHAVALKAVKAGRSEERRVGKGCWPWLRAKANTMTNHMIESEMYLDTPYIMYDTHAKLAGD